MPRAHWFVAVVLESVVLSGCAGSDNSAEPEPDPPSIQMTAVRQAANGQPVDPADVRGEIEVVVEVENAPGGSCVELVIDGTTASPCVAAARPSTGAPVVARVLRTESSVRVVITLSVNTADFNTGDGRPKFLNGQRQLSARSILGAGNQPIQTQPKQLIFNNQNFIQVNVPGPTGPNVWRSGDIPVTVTPVIFTNQVVSNVTVTGTWASGGGIDFGNGPGQPSAPFQTPFNVVVPGQKLTNEEIANFIITAFTGSSQTVAQSAPFAISVDNRAPRLVFNKARSSGFENGEFSFNAMKLNRATGPYAANELINITRITGGSFISPHTGAPNPHVHGNIFIADPIGGANLGPFPDPEFIFGDPNGHGDIIATLLQSLTFRFAGTAVDGSPLTVARVAAYRAVGTCDGANKVDDVLLAVGTTSGSVGPQNPINVLNSTGNLDVTIDLFGNNTFQPTTICFDFLVRDSGVGTDGQPGPTSVAFVQQQATVKY